VLQAQDAALGRIVDYLDKEVGDYVIIVTADHGNTYPAAATGGWPILQGQLQADIDAHFEVPEGDSLTNTTSAAGPFLNRPLMAELNVTEDDVARFLNGYTIADNSNEPEPPDGYKDRGGENVFSAVFASDQYDQVMECAFGAPQPPEDLKG
jgi:arylsulfatase A-like enzyme